MIYTNSRYANGKIFKAYDSRNNSYQTTVFRTFPDGVANFYYYVWADRDRMELVAFRLLGSQDRWWELMDYNPEIGDPFDIPVGTRIRVPHA